MARHLQHRRQTSRPAPHRRRETRQQTNRTHPPHPRTHHHQLETSPRPTHHRLPRPNHPLPLTPIHRKIDRLFSRCRAQPWAAREPSAPRASIGAPSQSPARLRRPRGPRPACPAARPSDLAGALRTGGAFGADVARLVALTPSYGCQPAIPHAIPPRLFQALNSQR